MEGRTYLILSKWAYPFGGGEDFLYVTMEWANRIGMKAYWLCFTDAKNNNFKEFSVEKHKYGTIIKLEGGFNVTTAKNWVKLLKPDIIHHQGHERSKFFIACQENRVEFLSGFHFWSGAITLDTTKKNTKILENAQHHSIDHEILSLYNKQFCNLYTVTPFVSECIKKITNINITDHIYASSSKVTSYVPNIDVTKNNYVTMINIHKLKGGEILFRLLNDFENIPFIVVQSEFGSEQLDAKIKNCIDERNLKNTTIKSIYYSRLSCLKSIFQRSKIVIVPTLVDETFCKVVNESMMNGIPVLTSGYGNTKYLLNHDPSYVIDPEDYNRWKSRIHELYFNNDSAKEGSQTMLQYYKLFSEEAARDQFAQLSEKIIKKGKEYNIMIFSPWCDQGLGIQSRNYAQILQEYGYNVSIFAIKPYNAPTCLQLQKDPTEWEWNNVYYSPNSREDVMDTELIDFFYKYNIGKCLIPETCWFRVFEVAKLCRSYNIKCYAIPNIEIVRKDEIYKHKYFHKILCNNFLCQNIFNRYGIDKTEYIGYGIKNESLNFSKNINHKKLKFLFIGGMNAFSRKHILDICEAFAFAYTLTNNIHLTCTIQKKNKLEQDKYQQIEQYYDHPGIQIIENHLAYSDIMNLYKTHHISIQVSKHEGLGIGFYEALATGTPIITLDTPPHNEIIKDNVNGWIVPCHYKPMVDNKDPIFDSAYFNPQHLADKIVLIASSENIYNKISITLFNDYLDRIDFDIFRKKFINSLII